ncbi:MAG: hypothetical protein OEX17_06415 [Rhodospirillaceae bacterium]|nr:hypothetical protein [Rhodospirillaceae bacterium]
MTHLLHEVKEELDWAARELAGVEKQFIEIEQNLRTELENGNGADLGELKRQYDEQKKALNINELHAILSRAARRFSLLSRVFEIGAANEKIEDIVELLMDGLLFRQSDTSEGADGAILQLAEALQCYFHVCLDDEGDQKVRDAWMEVQGILQQLGRKI